MAGKSRQGLTVRTIHSTASKNRRLFLPLRPGSSGLPRQCGSIFANWGRWPMLPFDVKSARRKFFITLFDKGYVVKHGGVGGIGIAANDGRDHFVMLGK